MALTTIRRCSASQIAKLIGMCDKMLGCLRLEGQGFPRHGVVQNNLAIVGQSAVDLRLALLWRESSEGTNDK